MIVDDLEGVLIYPSLAELKGDPENEFLMLGWDIEDHAMSAKFIEENNQKPEWSPPTLTLQDNEDNEFKLKLLVPMMTWAEADKTNG